MAVAIFFAPHAGIVFYYTLFQTAVWWFLHVAALFWGIRFPLQAKALATSNCQKYFHLVMVLLGLTLPIIPVIATLASGGFGLTRFPVILCTGKKGAATFYSLVLPIGILMQIGVSLLILIFWTIYKVTIIVCNKT